MAGLVKWKAFRQTRYDYNSALPDVGWWLVSREAVKIPKNRGGKALVDKRKMECSWLARVSPI